MKKELEEYVKYNRREFSNTPLDLRNLADTPEAQFELWFDQALKSAIVDPFAFTLATANKNGMPSARVVYMREYTTEGLSFFTNYNSRKGRDLDENPQFSGNFYWEELSRQVRFNGRAERLSAADSDAYFASRPRDSQLGAWASDQSEELTSRETLQAKQAEFATKFAEGEVPRPPHWGGYLLIPEEVEFWQGRAARLHDRFLYTRQGNEWHRVRLSP